MRMSHLVIIMNNILHDIEKVFKWVNDELPLDQRRPGGYFCLSVNQRWGGPPLLVLRVGEPPEGKRVNFFEFCQEKAARLGAHPEHLTASQSRDETAKQYGGAVRLDDFILSFSGLPEEYDEELLLMLLEPNRWLGFLPDPIDPEQIAAIRQASQEVYHPAPASSE